MNKLSENIFYISFFLILMLLVGCDQSEESENTAHGLGANAVQGNTKNSRIHPLALKSSPIELAQKEYLDAYNEYVRLLRESGPQTFDTLQALALYQKNYQFYQMLLRAENATNTGSLY